jgi:hypothetical protein
MLVITALSWTVYLLLTPFRTEAFQQVFSRTLPNILMQMVLAGASPQFLRHSIVHGGAQLDLLIQTQFMNELYTELESRLWGSKSTEAGPSRPLAVDASPMLSFAPRDGVCFN